MRGWLLLSTLAGLSFWFYSACSGEHPQSNPTPPQGSEGGSGGAGGAAEGGKATSGGAGKPTGHAGSGGGSLWEKIGVLQGLCIVERLKDPSTMPAFTWGPCDWTTDVNCEEAIRNEKLLNLFQYGQIYAIVHDDGASTKAMFVIANNHYAPISVLTNEDGSTIDAYRSEWEACDAAGSNVRGKYFSVSFLSRQSPVPGGIVGEIGKGPILFDVSVSGNLAAGTQSADALGNKRWAWWWSQGGMISFSNEFGGDMKKFVTNNPANGPTYIISNLKSAGDNFLLVEYSLKNNYFVPTITISDGIDATKPFMPTDGSTEDATPIFADTHVAWLRGFDPTDLNLYKHVELWASPFSSHPEELKPAKITDFPYPNNNIPFYFTTGGWGRVAHGGGGEKKGTTYAPGYIDVWDLTKPSKFRIDMPDGIWPRQLSGLTRTHIWFTIDKLNNAPKRLFRWKLPPGGTSP